MPRRRDRRRIPTFELQPLTAPAPRPATWPAPAPRLSAQGLRSVRAIGTDPDADLTLAAWPAHLLDLIETAEAAIAAHLCDHPDCRDPLTLARVVVVGQAHTLQGTKIHFPYRDKTERMLRDAAIWRDFDGRNHAELRKKYRIEQRTLLYILARQRELRRARAARRRAARP